MIFLDNLDSGVVVGLSYKVAVHSGGRQNVAV